MVHQPFRWASVTKMVTAWAVLVAVEEGTVDLDGPAGPPGATLRHLLAHASGLGQEGREPIGPPGQRRIYSNTGYRILVEVLEQRSGIGWMTYVRSAVLDPLGMAATTFLPDHPSGLAAAGLTGPVGDLLRFGLELADPRLIDPSTAREATGVQFPGLAGDLPGFAHMNEDDWGLGPEVRGTKFPHWTGANNSPQTYGHFGRSGSFLWVDPVAGVLAGGLANRPFSLWASRAWPRLADALLAESADVRASGN